LKFLSYKCCFLLADTKALTSWALTWNLSSIAWPEDSYAREIVLHIQVEMVLTER
jgi:hypothetical protein